MAITEDAANKTIIDFLKFLLKKSGSKVYNATLGRFSRVVGNKVNEKTGTVVSKVLKTHKQSSLDNLAKKSANGVHRIDGLSKKKLSNLTKSLTNARKDFFIEKDKTTGKYSIYVGAQNKAFCDMIIDKLDKTEAQANKESLKNVTERCEKKAAEINAKNATEKSRSRNLNVHKHKEIGAR